jgi:ATP-dependent Clp protease ATP-binding subunit ClpA
MWQNKILQDGSKLKKEEKERLKGIWKVLKAITEELALFINFAEEEE